MQPMSSERWHRIQDLLDAALDAPPAERDALLDDACAGDAELRTEIARLLVFCERAEQFLEEPAAEFASPLLAESAAADSLIGTQIGVYRILAEAGVGGMGTVYLAERNDDQYSKRVAIKVVRQSFDRASAIARFLEERQILASMEHPDIARLIDGGVTDTGLPYLVMEYVEGTPIDRYCDERELDVPARLRLFCRICDAVQYAHRNLVVHRDLKPSNILVTADGDVKLLDFGIARLLRADTGAAHTITMLHPLTPEYASPEQLRGEATSTASDVYSLGVLLYRLLTGKPPYDTTGASAFAVARAVLESEPERPSGVVDGALRRQLAGDLDAVTLKALEKDPSRRYDSVEQFAADIRRHLESRPVLAGPVTFRYLSARFIRRNRTLVIAAALIVASLLGGTALAVWQARRATMHARIAAEERDRARTEAVNAAQVSTFLTELFDATNYDRRGDTITARNLLDHGASRIRAELADQPDVQARLMVVMADSYLSMGLVQQARELAERALDQLTELHGPVHADVANALHVLGEVLLQQSEVDEALAVYQRGLDVRRSVFGDSTVEMADGLQAVGLALHMKGRYDDAEQMLTRALELYPNTPDGRGSRASVLSNIGWVMAARGNRAAADSAFTASLAIRREQLGPAHKLLAAAMSRVAFIRARRNDFVSAEPLAREALAMNRELLGDRHPEVAASLASLASLMEMANRTHEADSLYAEALALTRELNGIDDLASGQAANNYAGLLRRMGHIERATAMYQEALRVYRLRLGDAHAFTAVVRGNVAGMQLLLGDRALAESLYRESLQTLRDVRGDDDPVTATVMLGLGSTLRVLGRLEEARPLLRAALDVRRDKLPPGHGEIGMAESALGAALSMLGVAEAESLLVHGYQTVRTVLGDDAVDTRVARAALVEHYERTGQNALAAEYRDR